MNKRMQETTSQGKSIAGILCALVFLWGGASHAQENAFALGVQAYDTGDHAKAYALWLPLARAQDPAAQRNVAHLLRRGLGVEQDKTRALWFYETAGKNGVPMAKVNAAQMLLAGEGVAPNNDHAVQLLRQAALQGVGLAAFLLGVLHEQGKIVPASREVAMQWYALAKLHGHEIAHARLQTLGWQELGREGP